MEEIIAQDFIKWIKENHLHLFIKEYVNVAMSYLYNNHYEHYFDNNPYDFSGDIKNTYTKNINQINTLCELMDCYVGERMPTYVSNYGWYFITIRDQARNAMDEIYIKLLYEYVRLNPSIFNIKDTEIINDDKIHDIIDDFDFLYIYNYDIYTMVENFLGIKNIDSFEIN